MAGKHILLRTNILICVIIAVGFMMTAILGYRADYNSAVAGVEQVSALTSEGIVTQISTMFAKPVNMSLTMASDSLLIDYLSEESEHLEDEQYVETIRQYLKGYRDKYEFDSVFLASAVTQRYYNFNGIDRVLTKDNRENKWYYSLLNSDEEYALAVDNDEVANANNDITIFVNCKITDDGGKVLGIIGVGLKVDYLQSILKGYKDKVGVNASLVDSSGVIQVSSQYNGYQNVSLFKADHLIQAKTKILGLTKGGKTESFWVSESGGMEKSSYIVTSYIPEMSWHLVVEQETGQQVASLQKQVAVTVAVIGVLLILVLVVITHVIKGFNRQVLRLTTEQEETFRKATEQLYDNIYEINVTDNCAEGTSTKRYFESVGVPPYVSFDKGLAVIAKKQIKEEFREGYINTLSTENVLRQYKNGNTHLQYDFMHSEDGRRYYWMHIDAYIYKSVEDGVVRMFIYRKNIDQEKRDELKNKRKMQTDEMTGLYTRTATQHHISEELSEHRDLKYAFYIFDIDNFKLANDQYGHAFGDSVIVKFASIIKEHFRGADILGRIGGDEFVAFIRIPDTETAVKKAQELSKSMDRTCEDGGHSWKMTASIGVAIAPDDGDDFETLYQNADAVLYETKQNGRNGFTVYGRH